MDKSRKQDFILFFKADWGNLLSSAQIAVGEYLQKLIKLQSLIEKKSSKNVQSLPSSGTDPKIVDLRKSIKLSRQPIWIRLPNMILVQESKQVVKIRKINQTLFELFKLVYFVLRKTMLPDQAQNMNHVTPSSDIYYQEASRTFNCHKLHSWGPE